MSEPKQEAQKIVDEHEAALIESYPSHPWDERYRESENRLVDALAAAMNNYGAKAHHGLCASFEAEDEMMCDCGTAWLREALSALRGEQQ